MKVQHLNFCRQARQQIMEMLLSPRLRDGFREPLSHAVDLIAASQKFILPDGGRIIDDPELKALDDETLSLPYEFVALEFFQTAPPAPGYYKASKRIALCRQRDDYIAIMAVFRSDHDGLWRVSPEVAIPRTECIDRSQRSASGIPLIRMKLADERNQILSDYEDEVLALLFTLNALRCANVRVERSEPNRPLGKRDSLPFDAYHVLTVDPYRNGANTRTGGGTNRSPREHLRRGHIRRYESGIRIWVNATVVNAGKGYGVVSKDYAIKARG